MAKTLIAPDGRKYMSSDEVEIQHLVGTQGYQLATTKAAADRKASADDKPKETAK